METFYSFLGGPRTFWGNSNRTIINNNFIGAMPMTYGFSRPMPIFGAHHCCGGNSKALNWMLGFGLASSIVGGIMNTVNQSNNANVNFYNPYQTYNNPYYNPYNNNNYTYNYSNQDLSSLTAKVNKLEDELETYQKQIQELLQNNENKENKEVKTEVNTETTQTQQQKNTQPEIQKKQEVNTQNETQKVNKEQKTETPTNIEKSKETTEIPNNKNKVETVDNSKKVEEPKQEKTLDDILNEIGFNNLDETAKNYVKSRISQVYIDNNGNIKYDIKAIVHDGDNLNTIIDRFYTDDEKENLEVAKAKFHTQGSETKLIVNPLSGDTITANGVSEYGLKALMEDAKKGITRQGEITKTNKRIYDLKAAFTNGEKKLSKAYVLQNKLMTEEEYNKIIKEKYS